MGEKQNKKETSHLGLQDILVLILQHAASKLCITTGQRPRKRWEPALLLRSGTGHDTSPKQMPVPSAADVTDSLRGWPRFHPPKYPWPALEPMAPARDKGPGWLCALLALGER